VLSPIANLAEVVGVIHQQRRLLRYFLLLKLKYVNLIYLNNLVDFIFNFSLIYTSSALVLFQVNTVGRNHRKALVFYPTQLT